ncbi:hypothetical protein [Fibrobacter sp. UWB11]|uniref:hypothetical protein n=1 Tax=Fibrobacter sp. UWB11 TaxID=1896202 RepID=UPI0009299C2C|nr:hypothetical protein [Fibrobacter sp. UWB11]SIN99104.1 hypothetical protein SAMN05720758_0915 [Fibrobacter sp. UWB11]
MRSLFIILFTVTLSFAQVGQDPMTRHHDCYYSSPLITHDTIDYVKGMQLQTQPTDTTNVSNEPSLSHTVDISGIVDTVVDSAIIEVVLQNGKISYKRAILSIADDKPLTFVHRILLRNFKATSSKESPMTKALDSSWIFVPLSFQIKPSDSIFIKGYSALYQYIWSEFDCRYDSSEEIRGEFFVYPNTSSIKSTRMRKGAVIKKRNRDAIGKKQSDNTARKIVY